MVKNLKKMTIVLGFMLVASVAQASPAFYARYNCSLKIYNQINAFRGYNGEVVRVDIRDQVVEVDAIGDSDKDKTVKSVEAFPVSKYIQQQVSQPIYFMTKAYWKDVNGTKVPQLSVGMYYFNKFMEDKKKVHAEAVGEANGSVKLMTTLPNSHTVEFNCDNKELSAN